MTKRLRTSALLLMALPVAVAACGGGSASGKAGPSKTSTTARSVTTSSQPPTTTTTTEQPSTTSTTAPSPTLGVANSACQGCGGVAPSAVTLQGYSQNDGVFGGMVFTQVQWQSWGSAQATAPGTHAYFESPGESGTVTLVAFDPGMCGNTYSYRALEWLNSSQSFDPSSYYDVCSGTGVGRGFPGSQQENATHQAG